MLTDHSRREVVLVLRGTMSLNELAVDLTCEPADYIINSNGDSSSTTRAGYSEEVDMGDIDEDGAIPGSLPQSEKKDHVKENKKTHRNSRSHEKFEVHSGMLRMARAMGSKGRPVHVAVRNALRRNHGYSECP